VVLATSGTRAFLLLGNLAATWLCTHSHPTRLSRWRCRAGSTYYLPARCRFVFVLFLLIPATTKAFEGSVDGGFKESEDFG